MASMKLQLAQGIGHEDLIHQSLDLAVSAKATSVFLKLYSNESLAQAKAFDEQSEATSQSSSSEPLRVLPVSITDLFDEKGECTAAGSVVLQGSFAASQDAPAVAALRASGAIVLGRTNMTEFAFSGIGINPHFGTPKNAHSRDVPRVPGGSSSGSAVAVALGLVPLAGNGGFLLQPFQVAEAGFAIAHSPATAVHRARPCSLCPRW